MSSVRSVVRMAVVCSSFLLFSFSVGAFAQMAPTCTLGATPTSGPAPLPVTFTASCTDPNQNFSSGEVVFGDGAFLTFSALTPAPISHVYYRTGSFQSTVFGFYATAPNPSASQSVTVTPFMPTGPPSVGDIYISGDNGTIEARKPDGTLSNIFTVPRNDFLGGMEVV